LFPLLSRVLFDRAITLRRLLPKLVRSVAMDGIDRRPESASSVKAELLTKVAEHFLEGRGNPLVLLRRSVAAKAAKRQDAI
jgi:hypothetical protein